MIKKTIISWSSGKDSALTLLRLQENPDYDVVGLYTTYVGDGVPFQNTPLNVVKAQADRLGLPLIVIPLPEVFPPNDIYQWLVVEGIMQSGVGIDAVAFGDMFCNGIADYRRSYIEPAGWEAVFPLLGNRPASLASEIINRGIQTRVCTIDTAQLDGRFCGEMYNADFLSSLPGGVDLCGEDGEFHTLVLDMPGFASPLSIEDCGINCDGRFHFLEYRLSDSDFTSSAV